MAHVWAARERGPDGERLVALKIIHSRFAEDSDFRAMFVDEARIVASIEHPNIARVFQLHDDPDQLYIVMEYIDGESLFGLVSQYRTAPIPVALAIAADAASGLHAVHSLLDEKYQPRNVVHRDISPQNILITTKGETKLIDFGIAHASDRSQKTTALGTVKGKIRYMAPEQARREKLGPWTDVFGLGATLFRVVVGKAPYTAESDIATTQALLAKKPALIPFPPNFPAPVADVIKKAIAPTVEERYATAFDFERALRQVLAQTGAPDIGAWITANMSEKARTLRDSLQNGMQNGAPAPAPAPRPDPGMMSIPDLTAPKAAPVVETAPLPAVPPLPPPLPPAARTPKGTEVMKPLAAGTAPTVPDQKRGPLPAPPPPNEPQQPQQAAPGFMDVRALVANAKGVPELPVPAPKQSAPAAPKQATPEVKLELAYEPTNRVAPPPSTAPIRTAILVVAGILLVFVFLFAVPFIVKSRAVSQAREAGFEMTAEHVGVGFGTATFKDVTLKAIKVPGVVIKIDQLGVTGASVKELHAVGMDFELSGDPKDWDVGLMLLLSENRIRFAGTPQAPRHFTIAGSHFAWTGVNGLGADASDVGIDVESRGNGNEDVKVSIAKLLYKTPKTTIGPWGATVEETPTSNRVRVALDPAVPDGPSILAVTAPGTAATTITVNILRTSMVNLGLKPTELGLPADGSSEIESKMSGTVTPDKITLTGTNQFWGLRVAGVPKPLDVMTTIGLEGPPGQTLDIQHGSNIQFGPFNAQLTGTVTTQVNGLRVDAIATAATISCATLTRAQSNTMGSFTAMMGALGQAVTGLKPIGNVSLSASLKYDTSDPSATSVTWLAKETCGLSIFGSPN